MPGALNRLLHLFGSDPPEAPVAYPAAGRGKDPLIAEVTELACGVAESCAALNPEAAEDAIKDIVVGRINAALNDRTKQVSEQALREELKIAGAREQQQVVDNAADALDEEATMIVGTTELKNSKEREAKEQVEAKRNPINELPLLARVKTPGLFVVVAVAASTAGIGTLARLSLAGVQEQPSKWLVTVAAVGGAFAAELVIGTLGAEGYERLSARQRRWAVGLVLIVILLLIGGTEILAAIVRQHGAEASDIFTTSKTTGQATSPKGFTPNLIWTGPLAILVTVAGSGVVGLTRVRESEKPTFDALKDAKDRLAAAQKAVRDDEQKVKELREQATRRREKAAGLRGQASIAETQREHLVAAIQQISDRHAELIRAIVPEALATYRVAAERYARSGEADMESQQRRRIRPDRGIPLTLGYSGLAGTLASLATASVIPGLLVGSIVMILGSLRTA
jgi:hypothetical protein